MCEWRVHRRRFQSCLQRIRNFRPSRHHRISGEKLEVVIIVSHIQCSLLFIDNEKMSLKGQDTWEGYMVRRAIQIREISHIDSPLRDSDYLYHNNCSINKQLILTSAYASSWSPIGVFLMKEPVFLKAISRSATHLTSKECSKKVHMWDHNRGLQWYFIGRQGAIGTERA